MVLLLRNRDCLTSKGLALTQLWRHCDTILCRNHENRCLTNQDGHWVTLIRRNNLDSSKTKWKENISRKLKFCGTQKFAPNSINTEKGTSEIKDKCSPYISKCTPTDRNHAIIYKWPPQCFLNVSGATTSYKDFSSPTVSQIVNH